MKPFKPYVIGFLSYMYPHLCLYLWLDAQPCSHGQWVSSDHLPLQGPSVSLPSSPVCLSPCLPPRPLLSPCLPPRSVCPSVLLPGPFSPNAFLPDLSVPLSFSPAPSLSLPSCLRCLSPCLPPRCLFTLNCVHNCVWARLDSTCS